MTMSLNLDFNQVNLLTIDDSHDGQRLDNFLLHYIKGVPKSHIYRLIRAGEVRVNKKRADAQQRLMLEDIVRIPPVRVSSQEEQVEIKDRLPQRIRFKSLSNYIVYEDNFLIAINKPSGLAVHGGTGIHIGLIEQLRLERPEIKFLELVHRLDKDTSGILLIAKRRRALVALHEMMKAHQVQKYYLTLVKGKFRNEKQRVQLNLYKYHNQDGEAFVKVVDPKNPEGKHSATIFTRKKFFTFDDQYFTLLQAKLETGRTHQIRVHLAHLGYPIVGDEKYGNYDLNHQLEDAKINKRMFLHAYRLVFNHPIEEDKQLDLIAPLSNELKLTCQKFTMLD